MLSQAKTLDKVWTFVEMLKSRIDVRSFEIVRWKTNWFSQPFVFVFRMERPHQTSPLKLHLWHNLTQTINFKQKTIWKAAVLSSDWKVKKNFKPIPLGVSKGVSKGNRWW